MMSDSTKSECASLGRANMVLVHGQAPDVKGALSAVIARVESKPESGRITFAGSVTLSPEVVLHIQEVVLPIVDRITDELGLHQKNFEISAVNVGAASAMDRSMRISGFSADVPIFLALLSSVLDLPVPDDIVATGHLASVQGDIRAVQSLPEKIEAASTSSVVKRFLYPSLKHDASLAALIPKEAESMAAGIVGGSAKLKLRGVGDVAELLRSVFLEKDLVLSGLRKGYLRWQGGLPQKKSALSRATVVLAQQGESRFWRALESALLEGCNQVSHALFVALSQYHQRFDTYPVGLGQRLHQLVASLPPTTRRLKTVFPLFAPKDLLALTHLADAADLKDVRLLFMADAGAGFSSVNEVREKVDGVDGDETKGKDALAAVFSLIAPAAVASKIGVPIETARSSYIADSILAESQEEFDEAITAYYMHMIRHCRGLPKMAEGGAAKAEAMDLVERAFAGQGGYSAAKAEARWGVNGGLRFVFDRMTAYFKKSEAEKYVNMTLKIAFDEDDWPRRVAVTKAFMDRLAPYLPSDILAEPAGRYSGSLEVLVRLYIESLENLNALMRSL